MSTFKRFLQYYKPYKGIFFMDLFCALIMCIVDLSFPLILSYCTGQFFLNSSNEILKGVFVLGIGLLVMYYSINTNVYLSLIMISTIQGL